MPFECTLTMTGTSPETSAQAFIDSYNETAKMSHYQGKLNHIQQYFQNKLERNMAQAKIQNTHLANSFSVHIQGNNMIFSSNDPRSAVYEYGSGSMSPKRYLQPSIIDTANEMSSIIVNDAIEVYEKKIRFGSGVKMQKSAPPLLKSNKYSKMLK